MTGNPVINLNAAKVRIMLMERQGTDAEGIAATRKLLERTQKLLPNDPGLARTLTRFKKILSATAH